VKPLTFQDSRVWIDLQTESHAKSGIVRPDSPSVRAVDSRGRSFPPGLENGPPLDTQLKPGEKSSTQYTFFMLPDSERPVVEVTQGRWFTRLLIGHPNSLYHKRPGTPID
jgi:hypothetical protein